ncbi:MAG: questin oxidase family protein [Nocardioides sp.]
MDHQSTLDEALDRLHRYGPEFAGWLSNHGPMAVEAMARRGHDHDVHPWTDRYLPRLEDAPGSGRPLGDEWREALGRPTRAGDWLATFRVELADEPWAAVLARWWPRLLPGIAAGATHGVIRVGHASRSLRAAVTEARVAELAHALAYWAMRWQSVPLVTLGGARALGEVLEGLPVVADQSGGIRDRLAQLPGTPGYLEAAAGGAPAGDAREVPARLESLVDAAVRGYARWAPGDPTMLVHAATAPNAVLATLPSLPPELRPSSLEAAWSATAAVVAAYRPPVSDQPTPGPAAEDAFEVTVALGSEHLIKFADTALSSFERTGDRTALAAIGQAVRHDA